MDKLLFVSKDLDVEIYFPYSIVLIEGDSGVGKTYFLTYLSNILREDVLKTQVKANFDLNKTKVYLNEVPDSIYQLSGYTIFIDRLDMFATPKLLDFINKSNNNFVLFPRGDKLHGFKVISQSFLDMERKVKNNKVYLKAYPIGYKIDWNK